MSLVEKLDPILKLMGELVTANTAYECDMISRAITQQMCALAAQGHGPAIRQAMIDARRYRWLRDTQQTATTSDWLGVYPADSRQCYYGPRLDAAIDAARATGEGE